MQHKVGQQGLQAGHIDVDRRCLTTDELELPKQMDVQGRDHTMLPSIMDRIHMCSPCNLHGTSPRTQTWTASQEQAAEFHLDHRILWRTSCQDTVLPSR